MTHVSRGFLAGISSLALTLSSAAYAADQDIVLELPEKRSNVVPTLGNGMNPRQATISLGPALDKNGNKFYRIGPNGGQRFHFYANKVSGTFTSSDITSKAKSIAATEKSNNKVTHVWDDRWYYRTLPTSGDTYLLCFWVDWDVSPNRIEWAAVKNSPSTWTVKTSDGRTVKPGNGDQVKVRFNVTGSNQTLDIDIFNPDNTGDWTSNDIWYGFGF